jgi:hypothetical protein
MSARARSHIRANLTGYLAVFLALGGTAWALQNNSVRSRHIIDGQVRAKDIRLSHVQARVDGACTLGTSIRAISKRGSVACEAVGGAGPPTGGAGGGLTGSYPNPAVRSNAVDGARVVDDSLGGADLGESTLAQVPSALIGGFGRDSSTTAGCDPESTTFINCHTTSAVAIPAGARALVLGTIEGDTEQGADVGHGECRLQASSNGVVPSTTVDIDLDDGTNLRESFTLVGVTGPLPATQTSFRLQCNQIAPGAIEFEPDVFVAAVVIGSS